ncbi:MAG: alpha/beta hydrolase [Deltaproteobacteria bacterium]|nr:alpha/beta hydrolase [Deltaproteobacteria bacterium]MBW2415951.1 alpha/beta hydrolase [Deltaproteobacteria bacterium]
MASLQANGITIEYEDTGGADRPAIVLIRGLGTQLIDWPVALVETLSGAGFRVIRPDNRDAGLSSKLDAFGAPDIPAAIRAARNGEAVPCAYTLEDMARDVVALLDVLGIEAAHVVGMSMGGFIVQRLAANHPTRVLSMTSIMASSGSPDLPASTPEAAATLASSPSDPDDRDSVITHDAEVARILGSPGYPEDESERLAIAAARYDRSHCPDGVGRQMLAVIADGRRLELLGGIRVPTLVIHGRDDLLVRVEGGIDTAARIPGAKLELIDGMGHNIPLGLVPTLAKLIAEHASASGAR